MTGLRTRIFAEDFELESPRGETLADGALVISPQQGKNWGKFWLRRIFCWKWMPLTIRSLPSGGCRGAGLDAEFLSEDETG